MGTRGFYGIRKNNVDKLTYNHYDSYPDVLGQKIVKFIKTSSLLDIHFTYNRIVMVNGLSKPDKKQIRDCKNYINLPTTESIDDWYSLLSAIQGSLEAYKKGLKWMMDGTNCIFDSHCEFGYIINLDTNLLEFWVRPNTDYYDEITRYKNVATCVLTIPLQKIIDETNSISECIKEMNLKGGI